MRELVYGAAILAFLYVVVSLFYYSGVSKKESWAETQPKKTLGYIVGSHVTEDADGICDDLTTLTLDTGAAIRVCGTFPILTVGAAVETPISKYEDGSESFNKKLVFCVGDFCRLQEP